MLVVYECKWNDHAPTKGGALYSDSVHNVSFSTQFCYSVLNKDSNGILYVRDKLLRLTLFRLVLESILRVKRGLTVFIRLWRILLFQFLRLITSTNVCLFVVSEVIARSFYVLNTCALHPSYLCAD